MPPPRLVDVVGLDWDEQNERHVEEHIHAWLIEELIEAQDWYAFPNYPGHPPRRWLFIGRTEAGLWVTAIMREPLEENPGIWRPITGWYSTEHEKQMYRAERRRARK